MDDFLGFINNFGSIAKTENGSISSVTCNSEISGNFITITIKDWAEKNGIKVSGLTQQYKFDKRDISPQAVIESLGNRPGDPQTVHVFTVGNKRLIRYQIRTGSGIHISENSYERDVMDIVFYSVDIAQRFKLIVSQVFSANR
jgi:hypothetical protein